MQMDIEAPFTCQVPTVIHNIHPRKYMQLMKMCMEFGGCGLTFESGTSQTQKQEEVRYVKDMVR
jgi:hypothetical protein